MKTILLSTLAAAGLAASVSAQQPATSPANAASEAEKQFLESIPEKQTTVAPPPSPAPSEGMRHRGGVTRSLRPEQEPPAAAPAVAPLTRSGSVPRGVLKVQLSAGEAKVAAETGRVPDATEWTPERIKKTETDTKEFRVDPSAVASYSGITFELDKAEVTPAGREVLRGIADGMIKRPALRFLVEGHTCELGDDSYNDRLSSVRAAVVCTWLRKFGVPDAQIQPLGCGERYPLPLPKELPDISGLSDNAKEPFIAPNRRVEFRSLVDQAQP